MRMLAVEAVFVAVIGTVLGTAGAIVTLLAYSVGRADTLQPTGSPLIYVAVATLAVLVVLSAALVPGWRVTRRPAVEAVAAD
jgi:putative ABC transport system permease protein